MKHTFFECSDRLLRPETILFLESDGNYTRIHRQKRPPKLMAYTLKLFAERFGQFVRVRRNVLVNPEHIRAWQQIGSLQLSICLTDGTTVVASRRRLSEVKSHLIYNSNLFSDCSPTGRNQYSLKHCYENASI